MLQTFAYPQHVTRLVLNAKNLTENALEVSVAAISNIVVIVNSKIYEIITLAL